MPIPKRSENESEKNYAKRLAADMERRKRRNRRKREWKQRIQSRVHDRLARGEDRDIVARYVAGLMLHSPEHARSFYNLLDEDMRRRVVSRDGGAAPADKQSAGAWSPFSPPKTARDGGSGEFVQSLTSLLERSAEAAQRGEITPKQLGEIIKAVKIAVTEIINGKSLEEIREILRHKLKLRPGELLPIRLPGDPPAA
jgi:hypothetical protein